MDNMPRYVRLSYTPLAPELMAAFEALDTSFTRTVINYFAAHPGARVPDAAKQFDRESTTIFRIVRALEAVDVIQRIEGTERKIGSGWSYAYRVNEERVMAVLADMEAYLLARHEEPKQTEIARGRDGKDKL